MWRYPWIVAEPGAATFTYGSQLNHDLMDTGGAIWTLHYHFIRKVLFVDQDIFVPDAKLLQIRFYGSGTCLFYLIQISFVDICASDYNRLNLHVRPFFRFKNGISNCESVCVGKCSRVEW